MIEREMTPSGVTYRLSAELGAEEGAAFPLSDSRPKEVDRLARALESLWVEGVLEGEGTEYLLPWSEVYELDESVVRLIGLPTAPETELALEVITVYAPPTPEFEIRVKATHLVHGVLPGPSRVGPVFRTQERLLLAPQSALPLFEHIDAPMPPDLLSRLERVGQVKKAARSCGARIDRFLEQEDVVVPDAIGLEAEVISPDEVLIRPVLEGGGAEEFDSHVQGGPAVRSSYVKLDGENRRRMILPGYKKAAAEEIRQRKRITGSDVPRFFTNPEAFVSDEIDLSHFSRRVKGLIPRKYNSRPYVRAEGSGKDWFTISARVELAGEAIHLGPKETPAPVSPGEDGDPFSPSGLEEGETGSSVDAEGAPPLTPTQYAELCKTVMKSGERFVRHEDAWIEIDPAAAQQFLETWETLEKDESGELRLPRDKAALVLDVIDNLEELVYGEPAAVRGEGHSFLDEIPEYDVPTGLRATLMPHQLVGYRWLRHLLDQRFGGLLADDMGLGKTVQVISFLAHLNDAGLLHPTLIVLPTALMENWHREMNRFCPGIKPIYHHTGPDRLRDPQRIAQAAVVLTTYQTLLRDQLIMGQVDWQVVVSDEAQYVKNPTAQSTAVLKAMKARLRLALTGTPVENGLSELWCIVDFVQPGRLGSQREFRNEFEKPIREAADDQAMKPVVAALQERLTPHYLRRMKEDILDSLPPKSVEQAPIPMGERQAEYYGAVIRRLREGDDIPIAALQRLIQISSHPEVFRPSGASLDDLVEECPKLQATLEIVEQVSGRGEKVLIYTHYKAMQQILQELLEDRYDRHVPIINGEVAGRRRLDVVDRFNACRGFAAMLLAPQAAGVGLNITGANHVIHYTRLWNPAKESQATDRAHRLGQTRPVTVYYPIVHGDGFKSVEERLAELLAEKSELARNVMWPRNGLDVASDLQAWLMEKEPA